MQNNVSPPGVELQHLRSVVTGRDQVLLVFDADAGDSGMQRVWKQAVKEKHELNLLRWRYILQTISKAGKRLLEICAQSWRAIQICLAL